MTLGWGTREDDVRAIRNGWDPLSGESQEPYLTAEAGEITSVIAAWHKRGVELRRTEEARALLSAGNADTPEPVEP